MSRKRPRRHIMKYELVALIAHILSDRLPAKVVEGAVCTLTKALIIEQTVLQV